MQIRATFSLPDTLVKRVWDWSKRTGISYSSIVKTALLMYFDDTKPEFRPTKAEKPKG